MKTVTQRVSLTHPKLDENGKQVVNDKGENVMVKVSWDHSVNVPESFEEMAENFDHDVILSDFVTQHVTRSKNNAREAKRAELGFAAKTLKECRGEAMALLGSKLKPTQLQKLYTDRPEFTSDLIEKMAKAIRDNGDAEELIADLK